MAAKFADNPNVRFEVSDATGVTPESTRELVKRDVSLLAEHAYNEPVAELQQRSMLSAGELLQKRSGDYNSGFTSAYRKVARLRVDDAQRTAREPGQAQRPAATSTAEGRENGNGGPSASRLTEWGERSFGKRLKADDRLRQSWRETVRNVYRKETEVEWQQRANDFIAEHGVEGATALYFDPDTGLSASDRMALGAQLVLRMDVLAFPPAWDR